ncbi:MAG: ATP-binding cassette domain-containing protein [Candidatus Accumulibacter sp.]|jgi:putative ABC transport system ATP-binding protein|nr:ATP-binding cassette domain-containing protein [Accumulibacter sp.]
MPAAIEISGLTKRYGVGDAAVDALKGVDMTVQPGEVVGLIGPSGSGKSTLLKCLGAVIEPSAGRMALAGEAIYNNGWQVADLPALRRDRIGFVFQAPYLIPFLNVTDNVALLPMLAGVSNASAREQARAMLTAMRGGWVCGFSDVVEELFHGPSIAYESDDRHLTVADRETEIDYPAVTV